MSPPITLVRVHTDAVQAFWSYLGPGDSAGGIFPAATSGHRSSRGNDGDRWPIRVYCRTAKRAAMHQGSQASLLRFPCPFPIKAMGRASGDFEGLVFGIVQRHAPGLTHHSVRVRSSRGGKYLSVTVTILAEEREQLDAIYRDLSACERVLVAL